MGEGDGGKFGGKSAIPEDQPVALDSLMTDNPVGRGTGVSRMHQLMMLPSAPLRISSSDEQPKAELKTFTTPLMVRDSISPRKGSEARSDRAVGLPDAAAVFLPFCARGLHTAEPDPLPRPLLQQMKYAMTPDKKRGPSDDGGAHLLGLGESVQLKPLHNEQERNSSSATSVVAYGRGSGTMASRTRRSSLFLMAAEANEIKGAPASHKESSCC